MIEKNYLLDYGMNWVNAWRTTNNYKLWDEFTDHEIYEIVEPGYVFTSITNDVSKFVQ